MERTRWVLRSTVALMALALPATGQDEADDFPLSEATEGCIFCHEQLHPGIVADWRRSRHARTTPKQALEQDELARRISTEDVPEELTEVVVGCAECHTLNPDDHPDTVNHQEHQMHTVVTPRDCAVCHPVEAEEYTHNIMSHAYANLVDNPVFSDLVKEINGVQTWDGTRLSTAAPDPATNQDACLACHGTKVQVLRKETRKTGLGDMEFAVLSGWPNQGVGRVNPDESLGSCASCHTRHRFSIEMAREPYTCAQCHKGPDVPAYKVYAASKHGNIQASHGSEWNLDAVPWTPGEDFTAPTCATCHASLLVKDEDTVIAPRTHRMNDRLFTRLFGLPYAHPHPKEPTTHKIRNSAGLPLPTELSGEPVAAAVIDAAEQEKRRTAMQGVCSACHTRAWIGGHFDRLDHTIATTNAMTLTATQLLDTAWKKGVVQGLDRKGSIFDEALERMWVEQWLFYANSTRFASAMSGADYGVFANGRWQMAKNLREMQALLELKLSTAGK